MRDYLKYCAYKIQYKQKGYLDLSGEKFMYPTTLLPLLILIGEIPPNETIMPENRDLANYIQVALGQHLTHDTKTYIPLTKLPKQQRDASLIVEKIRRLAEDTEIAVENSNELIYIVEELIANIYEHSEFREAYIFAQRYKNRGVMDLCFVDDGITIPRSFERIGIIYDRNLHAEAIYNALHGLSSKREPGRGTGLKSVGRVVREGFEGEILIVSGFGAVYAAAKGEPLFINLLEETEFKGTLASIRVPLKKAVKSLYDFL